MSAAGLAAAVPGALIAGADGLQRALLQALDTLGLAADVDGQPGWPLPWRIAVETFAIDAGLARATAATLAAVALALLAFGAGLAGRRGRAPLWGAAAALLVLAPWPAAPLVVAPALPTSFHRSPTGFDAADLARGLRHYEAHCLRCHGPAGAGDGPDAAAQPVWPPTLAAGLPWKRAEGELYAHVRHGLRGRDGSPTMPGFADVLGPADTWAVLDALKLLAAGDAARRRVAWGWPLPAPALAVGCDDRPAQPLAAWRGQRLRLVVAGGVLPQPIEDPRFVTVVLAADAAGAAQARARGAQCAAVSAPAVAAYARAAGQPAGAAAGLQFLVDRGGWLRAVGRPGAADWSDDDLLCRAEAPGAPPPGMPADGLDGLLARIDAEPVQAARLALPHPR